MFIEKSILVGILIAITTALLGSFLILRRLVLIGDGFAHIAFGGIVIGAFLNIDPILSAIALVLISAYLLQKIEKRKINNDIKLGIIFSVALAIGIALITKANFTQDVHSYLFGSLVAINNQDLLLAGLLFIITIIFIAKRYWNLLFSTFDEEVANAQGIGKIENTILLLLTALTVVIAIRIIGVLLVSAFIILPAATSLLLSKSFKQMLLYASIVATISVIIGILLSYILDIASGAAIVIVNGILFSIAYLLKK